MDGSHFLEPGRTLEKGIGLVEKKNSTKGSRSIFTTGNDETWNKVSRGMQALTAPIAAFGCLVPGGF